MDRGALGRLLRAAGTRTNRDRADGAAVRRARRPAAARPRLGRARPCATIGVGPSACSATSAASTPASAAAASSVRESTSSRSIVPASSDSVRRAAAFLLGALERGELVRASRPSARSARRRPRRHGRRRPASSGGRAPRRSTSSDDAGAERRSAIAISAIVTSVVQTSHASRSGGTGPRSAL